MQPLPNCKTKIVATIGPASQHPEIIQKLILAGVNVFRLNFSHGTLPDHAAIIENIRTAATVTQHPVAIMGDLPGPKIRIGQIDPDPVELVAGDQFTLTTESTLGNWSRATVSLPTIPSAVHPGDTIFLNDGIIQLVVVRVEGSDVLCQVAVGGELRSRKGLNLPGIDLGISAFTPKDRECLAFAVEHRLDAVSQSFVNTAEDILSVKRALAELGGTMLVFAKIERAGALQHLDEILAVSDGIMVARGDLGVEIPVEEIAVVQKRIIAKANVLGKPVITATQMLDSMVNNSRPTRAEATDVANAVLDGTDCVMLSAESAMGKFPVESVAMLARIAAATEPHRYMHPAREMLRLLKPSLTLTPADLVSLSVETILQHASAAAVLVPTTSGHFARLISRFHLGIWILALTLEHSTSQGLQFTYGVHPIVLDKYPQDWRVYAKLLLANLKLSNTIALLAEGPSANNVGVNHHLELLDLSF